MLVASTAAVGAAVAWRRIRRSARALQRGSLRIAFGELEISFDEPAAEPRDEGRRVDVDRREPARVHGPATLEAALADAAVARHAASFVLVHSAGCPERGREAAAAIAAAFGREDEGVVLEELRALVVPGVRAERAAAAAERARRALESTAGSVSIAIAGSARHGRTLPALLAAARRALGAAGTGSAVTAVPEHAPAAGLPAEAASASFLEDTGYPPQQQLPRAAGSDAG